MSFSFDRQTAILVIWKIPGKKKNQNITSSEYSHYLHVKVYKKISLWIVMCLMNIPVREQSGDHIRHSCVGSTRKVGTAKCTACETGVSNYPLLGTKCKSYFYYEQIINPFYLKLSIIWGSLSCSDHTLIMKNMDQMNIKVRSLNFRIHNSSFPRSESVGSPWILPLW